MLFNGARPYVLSVCMRTNDHQTSNERLCGVCKNSLRSHARSRLQTVAPHAYHKRSQIDNSCVVFNIVWLVFAPFGRRFSEVRSRTSNGRLSKLIYNCKTHQFSFTLYYYNDMRVCFILIITIIFFFKVTHTAQTLHNRLQTNKTPNKCSTNGWLMFANVRFWAGRPRLNPASLFIRQFIFKLLSGSVQKNYQQYILVAWLMRATEMIGTLNFEPLSDAQTARRLTIFHKTVINLA